MDGCNVEIPWWAASSIGTSYVLVLDTISQIRPIMTDISIHAMAVDEGPAKLRDSIRILIGCPDSTRFESDGPIRKILSRRACHVCRRTINNAHYSTTNFNRFGIATGIYIEFN